MPPDYREANPYQRKLRDGLEAKGVTVILSDSVDYFAILGAVRRHGIPDIVHLHWLQSFTISDDLFKTAAGGLRLLCGLFSYD